MGGYPVCVPYALNSVVGAPFVLADGGVFANNPTLCAYVEARKKTDTCNLANDKQIMVLSRGTGKTSRPYEYHDAKDWGLVGWARPVLDIMMSGVSETVDYQMRQVFKTLKHPKRYLRIAPDLNGEVSADMDDASKANMMRLDELGRTTFTRHDAELKAFVRLLVATGDAG